MSVKKDLNISDCTDEDWDNLNLIIGTIGDHKLARENPEAPAYIRKIQIANLTLAIVYLENLNGGYNVWDYFGHHFEVYCQDDPKMRRISQFSTLTADEILQFDNLNLETIISDFKMIEPNDWLFELGNLTMLEILKAYDLRPSDELLNAAELKIKDIDVIGVCIGPGSFTGVRVAISICKGWLLAVVQRLRLCQILIYLNLKTKNILWFLKGFLIMLISERLMEKLCKIHMFQ